MALQKSKPKTKVWLVGFADFHDVNAPIKAISNYQHDLLQGGAGKGRGTLKGCLVPGALSCIAPQPAQPLVHSL